MTPLKIFHRIPRFGHSHTNITDIFSDSQIHSDAVIRYVFGAIFITAVFLVIFITWLLVLSFCKSLGRRAGICAGYPLETTSENLNTDAIGVHRKQRLFRFLMVMASLFIITTTCVFEVRATQSVSNLLGYLYEGAYGVTRLEQLLNDTGDDLGNFIDSAVNLKLNITQAVKGGVCVERGYYDPVIIEEVLKFFTSIQHFSNDKLIYLREEFAHTFGMVTNILLESIEILEKYAHPMHVAAPVVILSLIVTIVSILTLRNRGNKLLYIAQSWVVMPLFFIAIILLGLSCSMIGLALVTNAGKLRRPTELER